MSVSATALTQTATTEVCADGAYLYGVVYSHEETRLGNIGIAGNEVYTIPYENLAAVIHRCPAKPYNAEDKPTVETLVMTHQQVIDAAWERFGDILPSGFNVIIKDDGGWAPEDIVRRWLKKDFSALQQKLAKVKGKAEYGIQIGWEPHVIAQEIARNDEEIRRLEEEIKLKPRGAGYFFKGKLEKAIQGRMETLADRHFKDFFQRIKPLVTGLLVEKTKNIASDKQMLLNFSCLVEKDKYRELGAELETIDNMSGFWVRYTGPWPPYSFA
ncbi:MAG: GvpL/GvpF family gas vesicle protein [Acidobacteria bacterium]|nr:GvpL/GvpF family gas vesicle protein [Acidobacteriota bacterium]MBI3654834.1 GvpL/GvpF family gas vesicle protein [Acidobacteriota bacterium]